MSGIQIFDSQLLTKGSKGNAIKLWPTISYNCLRDSEPANNVFPNKLGNVFVFDVDISFCLYSFAKVVNGYK